MASSQSQQAHTIPGKGLEPAEPPQGGWPARPPRSRPPPHTGAAPGARPLRRVHAQQRCMCGRGPWGSMHMHFVGRRRRPLLCAGPAGDGAAGAAIPAASAARGPRHRARDTTTMQAATALRLGGVSLGPQRGLAAMQPAAAPTRGGEWVGPAGRPMRGAQRLGRPAGRLTPPPLPCRRPRRPRAAAVRGGQGDDPPRGDGQAAQAHPLEGGRGRGGGGGRASGDRAAAARLRLCSCSSPSCMRRAAWKR